MTDPTAPRDLTYEERATLQDLYAWSDRLTDDWLGLGERLRRYADAWKADVDELRAEIERLRQYEPLPGGVPLREVLLQREVERLTRELARYAYPPDHRVSMAEAERDRLRAEVERLTRERDEWKAEAVEWESSDRQRMAERDRLRAALDRIKRIGPLGVDTYPECYRRMHAIAEEALSAESSSDETVANPEPAEDIERKQRAEAGEIACGG